MATRTALENANLLRALVMLAHNADQYGDGELKADLETVNALLDKESTADNAIDAQKDVVIGSYTSYQSAVLALIVSISPSLGELGGAPSTAQSNINFAFFMQWLVDNSINLKKRGFIKASTSSFSGSGAGKLAIASVDHASRIIDVGHIGNVTVRCVRDATEGATAGRETFRVEGSDDRQFAWQEGGSSTGRGYIGAYGQVPADFGASQAQLGTGVDFAATASSPQGGGNLVPNGDLENPLGGTGLTAEDKWPDWFISSGHATITQIDGESEVAADDDPILGRYSLRATANFDARALLAADVLKTRTAYALGIKVMTHNAGGTVTGSLRLRVMAQDDSATYGTLTVDLSTLTLDVKTIIQPVIFGMPSNAKDAKVRLDLSSLGGSGGTPEVQFDDITLGPAALIDGHLLFLMDGATLDSNGFTQGRFKNGDKFTYTVASAEDGLISKWLQRATSRYFKVDTAASADWGDPAPAPVSQVRFVTPGQPGEGVVVDNGSNPHDMGASVPASPATNVIFRLYNKGNYPLVFDAATGITFSGETNVALAVVDEPASGDLVIKPGTYREFTIEVDPTGAGAFDGDVVVPFLDGASSYTFTIEGTAV